MIRSGKISKLVRNKLAREMMSKGEVRWITRSELEKLGPVTKTLNPMFNYEKYRRSLTDPNFDFLVNETCCLCGENITDFRDSHNPFPLTVEETDRCCTKCDWAFVIPKRFFEMNIKKNK